MQGSPARPTDRHHRVSDVLEGKPRWPNHGPQPTRCVLRVTGFVLAPLLVAVAIGPSIVPVGDVEDLTAEQLRDWSVASVNIAVASASSLKAVPERFEGAFDIVFTRIPPLPLKAQPPRAAVARPRGAGHDGTVPGGTEPAA